MGQPKIDRKYIQSGQIIIARTNDVLSIRNCQTLLYRLRQTLRVYSSGGSTFLRETTSWTPSWGRHNKKKKKKKKKKGSDMRSVPNLIVPGNKIWF